MKKEKKFFEWKILKLIESGAKPGLARVADEIGVSKRTALRYIRNLAAAGFPVYYDKNEKGYRFVQGYSPMRVELSGDDFESASASSAYMGLLGLAFRKSAEWENENLFDSTDERAKQKHRMGSIPFFIKADPVCYDPGMDRIFDTIVECYTRKITVLLDYCEAEDGGKRRMEVAPHGIVHYGGRLFLIGYCFTGGAERTFHFEEILSAAPGSRGIDAPPAPVLRKYLEKALGGDWEGGKIYRAKIRLNSEAAKRIGNRKWHPSQKTSYHADGTAVVSFKIAGEEELIKWALAWGDGAKIIYPPALRAKFIELIDSMRKNYRKSPGENT